MSKRRVGIIGGGVGGLTAAVALARTGTAVTVYERATSRRREGAALLLWANAMRVLAKLGLDDAVRAISAPVATTEFRTARGELLCALPIAEWSERSGAPTVVTPRRELLDILTSALPDGVVRTGLGFVTCTLDGDRVELKLDDGTMVELDGLVGADGLRSRVRAWLHGEEPPRLLDHDAWVGIAPRRPVGIVDGVTVASVGRGPRFWTAPLPGDRVFWYATQRRGAAALGAFADWHGPIPELVAATPAEDIIRTTICDRPPLARWGRGPTTLLGDAAHPSTPDLGQGGCQAIESAAVLADALAASPSVSEGFRAYERTRGQRTATVSRLCWLTSTNSTIETPALCAVRDAAIRFGLRTVARSHLDWLLRGPA